MSYLNALRLHFAGKFQAAPSTVNNDATNYDTKHFNAQADPGWNPLGSADWRLLGCRVTGAWHTYTQTVGAGDPILTYMIADSDRRAAAKLVDLDPLQQMVSAIWGLEVRICDGQGETLLRGQFETASFIDIWGRAIGDGGGGDMSLAAMFQSVLTNLEWGKIDASPFLKELQHAAHDGLLSIKFNVDGYNMDSNSPEFTYGRIVGTIGPASASEPRHCIRGRQFLAVNTQNAPAQTKGILNTCPALVDQAAGKILLDLGNALPTTEPGGPPAQQGELSLAYILPPTAHHTNKQYIALDTIAYEGKGWYEQTAGVVELPANRRLTVDELKAVATNPLTLLLPDSNKQPTPTLEEASDGSYVRADQFVFRLNPGEQAQVQLIATHFGQPYVKAQIRLTFDSGQLQGAPSLTPATPTNTLEFPQTVTTGHNGIAIATIHAHDPHNPRGYIDGQVYGIRPTLIGKGPTPATQSLNPANFISLHIFDNFHADEPPTWWGSIQPIFQQYANLYPIMDRFLDLEDYASVCENRQLLLLAFSFEDVHPNVMPVVRDLSAGKRKAILRWLKEVGQDGKPLQGTPPPPHATQPTAPPAQPRVAATENHPGGKTTAASRRLAHQPSHNPS